MIVHTAEHNNYLLAKVQVNEANLTVADAFKNELTAVIEQGHKRILVDFGNVAYIDSSFLGALVSSLKLAMAKGADIAVAHLNKDIYNLFELIRMDKVFKIYKELPDSL